MAARAADAKSGEDTAILAMGELLGLTDAFVITSGRNAARSDHRRRGGAAGEARRDGRNPVRVEGLDDARWVLMDYGDFLVHVFLDEARQFYDLEHLWADAPRVAWRRGADLDRSPTRPAVGVRAAGPGAGSEVRFTGPGTWAPLAVGTSMGWPAIWKTTPVTRGCWVAV